MPNRDSPPCVGSAVKGGEAKNGKVLTLVLWRTGIASYKKALFARPLCDHIAPVHPIYR